MSPCVASACRASFITPLVNLGAKRPLTEDDLGVSMAKDEPGVGYKKFEHYWSEKTGKGGKRRSFFMSIIKATGLWKW